MTVDNPLLLDSKYSLPFNMDITFGNTVFFVLKVEWH
jgi:hypothetical protein